VSMAAFLTVGLKKNLDQLAWKLKHLVSLQLPPRIFCWISWVLMFVVLVGSNSMTTEMSYSCLTIRAEILFCHLWLSMIF
jgi:hypothetical protein